MDGPLLRYPAFHLLRKGYDVFQISYAYLQHPDFSLDVLYEDVEAAVDAALQERDYRRIAVIGKSLGTVAMTRVIPAIPKDALTAKIWISPNFEAIGPDHEALRSSASLLVIGSADRQYDPALTSRLRRTGAEVAVVEGADHGVEDLTDMRVSLRLVAEAYSVIELFLDSRLDDGPGGL